MPTGRTLHRIWFYVPDARHTEQQRKRASSEYLRAVSGSIESDITNRVDRVEFSYEARHELFTARQRKFSIATQPNRYRVDHGGFGYLSQKGYWISPVFFDDDAAQTMRRRAWLRRLLLVKVTQLWPR